MTNKRGRSEEAGGAGVKGGRGVLWKCRKFGNEGLVLVLALTHSDIGSSCL